MKAPSWKLMSPKTPTRIGTWNVQTMYQVGKCDQIVAEMSRYKLEILGISEARWTGSGKVRLASGATVLFSGPPEDSPHEKGVALILSKDAARALMEWEPVSDRIITARLASKCQNTTVIQVYAPTDAAEEEDKEEFYNQLQAAFEKQKRRDVTLVMGDFNAQLGPDNANKEEVMGRHGEGTMTNNGDHFYDFCATNQLVIGGTLFPHPRPHKVTWRSPDGVTENQIDHIAISKRWRTSLQDVRSKRGADCGSDHHLVVADIKMKLAAMKRPRSSRTKYASNKLRDTDTRDEFILKLSNKYDALYNGSDDDDDEEETTVDHEWSKIKEMYTSTCEEVLGKHTYEKKEWMKKDTWKLIEDRRQRKKDIDAARTRRQKQEALRKYSEKNTEVKRSCRNDKRQMMDEIATEAEQAARMNDMKKVYEITRRLAGSRPTQNKPVRNREGILLTETKDQQTRWKEHFSEVLNRPPPEDRPDLPAAEEDIKINTGNITMREVKNTLKNLKNGKSAGSDNIPPEAWKAGGAVSERVLYGLLRKIWSSESIPEDWKQGLLVKLPKKGDLTQCKNWRGIMLLSVASKILCRIILDRMKDALDGHMRDEQAGFRKNRSCCDQIATLRIIIEQTLEWNQTLYMVFVDFEKAFDSLDRETLWKILRHYGIPDKIVKMIKLFYEDFQARVLHEGEATEPFEMKTGVRQGCMLSPLLFLLVLDWVNKQAFGEKKTGIQWTLTTRLEDLDFADDLVLLSQAIRHMRTKTAALETSAARVGLLVNATKTKEMRLRAPANAGRILCRGDDLERVEKFTYLGSVVTPTGGSEEDIQARIQKASGAFAMLRPVWRNRCITLRLKLRIFESNVKSVLLYGAETWRMTRKNISKLQAWTNKKLRYILGIWWPRRITNEDLWRRTKQEELEITIKRRKWRWIGHTLRKPPESITRQALEWNPQGHRRRGRPRHTWRRTMNEEIQQADLNWNQVKRMSTNRTRWRVTAEALSSVRSKED